MGQYLSRNQNGMEQLDIPSDSNYIFPPKSGSYFGTHFFIGGKKFETAQPEGYLFGENSDLNYLGPKPNNFSYHSPVSNQPVKALKCLVNIRKNSLRLIRAPNSVVKPGDVINDSEEGTSPDDEQRYNLEFTFDADCPCAITVYYNASEEIQNKSVRFNTTATSERSETVHFVAGCNQQYCLPTHVVTPSILSKSSSKTWALSCVPIAIQASAEIGPDFEGHSHITYAVFEKSADEVWNIKATKQKQVINGVSYLLQEIYGIENKSNSVKGDEDEDSSSLEDAYDEDNSECIVCLSDARDTIILPCKHLCLCSSCANQLRFQQSGCPICRQSFRALLQIRAVKKKSRLSPDREDTSAGGGGTLPAEAQTGTDEDSLPIDLTVPSGYEVIPLVSAINGPVSGAVAPLTNSDDPGMTSLSSSTSLNSMGTKGKVAVEHENETRMNTLGNSPSDDPIMHQKPVIESDAGEESTTWNPENSSTDRTESPETVDDEVKSIQSVEITVESDDVVTADHVVLGNGVISSNDATNNTPVDDEVDDATTAQCAEPVSSSVSGSESPNVRM